MIAWLRRTLDTLRAQWSRMTPRERILAQGAGALGVVLLVFFVFYSISNSINDIDSSTQAERDVLRQLDRQAADLRERERDRLLMERRYSRSAPMLGTYLNDTAQAVGLEIAESQDKPEAAHGHDWTERSNEIRLRKVGLRMLVDFMAHLENSGFPMAIAKLHIRKRYNEPDSYDVEMTVSTFDRKNAGRPDGGATPPGRARSGGPSPPAVGPGVPIPMGPPAPGPLGPAVPMGPIGPPPHAAPVPVGPAGDAAHKDRPQG